jgi:hypothetical protein
VIAHNLGIPKIMKLIHQVVVKGFMFCVPDHLYSDRAQLCQGAIDGGLVHMDNGGGSAYVIGTAFLRWVFDQALSIESQQQFPAGHVLKPAAGLNPVPMFAKFLGNMGPAPVPVFIDHGLDDGQVFGGNFAVSDD